MTSTVKKEYLHIDNGGILLTLFKEEESHLYNFNLKASYFGYPSMLSTFNGLDIEHVKFIKQFFIDLELE